MEFIKYFINYQFERIQNLEGILEAQKNLDVISKFLDNCSYCIARCILQDLISFQNLKKYDNKIIKDFCKKYKNTRDLHSHLFESNKKDIPLSLEELKKVTQEFHKMINQDTTSNYIYEIDDTLVNLLTKAFSVFSKNEKQLKSK